ncbi:unnamed protein product [Alopecurus aequalis]
MKKARRLVNIVTARYGGGTLSRVDANRHLFFPSTAQALERRQIQQQQSAAAAAKEEEEKAMPQKEDYGDVLPLPPSKLRFESPPFDMGNTFEFLPFGGGGARILCVNEAGGAILYDADAATVKAMPSLRESSRLVGLQLPASFAVTHADPARPGAFYVLDGVRHSFQALVYGDPTSSSTQFPFCGELDTSPWRKWSMYSGRYAWHWRQLPPPPVHDDSDSSSSFQSYGDRDSRGYLQCYALLNGNTICVSFLLPARAATYCFDTATGEWTKVGDWRLPFFSRALHVPELGDNLLFGIHGLSFCAIDVSGAMKNESAAPVLRHDWVDVDPTPPLEWNLHGQSVAYLGAGRFCIHRAFDIKAQGGYGDWDTVDTVTMLTGVEVVREAGSSKLRLVKHKTKRVDYMDHLL